MIRPSLGAVVLVVPLVLAASINSASAKGTFLSTWQDQYPTSQSDDNVINGTNKSCQLCHQAANGGDGWNGYGWAIKLELDAGAGIAAAIMAVEPDDSDFDPGAVDNFDEIDADAQPGWTEGAANTIYFKDGSTVGSQLPPGGIANLDPGGANAAPIADAGGPYSGTVGVAVTFDGSGSSDPDGTIVAYDWDFGDGNTGTGATPSHVYATDGTFTVAITVTDDLGATGTDTTTATIGVGNQAPTADAGGPYSGTVGVAINFDGTGSTDPDGTIVAYDWDFGDGGTGVGATPSYAYSAAGTYNVTLTVTDDAGATDSASTSAEVVDSGNQTPAAPESLVVTDNADGSAEVNWADKSDNEDGFEIERQGRHKKRDAWVGSTIISVAANVTAYTDQSGDGTFRYRVRSINQAGASAWTAWGEVTVTGGGGRGGGKGGGPKCNPRKEVCP
jgi:PKD repeat protein